MAQNMEHIKLAIRHAAAALAEHDMGIHCYNDGSPINVKKLLQEEADNFMEDNKDIAPPLWVVYSNTMWLEELDEELLFAYLEQCYAKAMDYQVCQADGLLD